MRLVLKSDERRLIPCTTYPLLRRNSARYAPSCPVTPVMRATFCLFMTARIVACDCYGPAGARWTPPRNGYKIQRPAGGIFRQVAGFNGGFWGRTRMRRTFCWIGACATIAASPAWAQMGAAPNDPNSIANQIQNYTGQSPRPDTGAGAAGAAGAAPGGDIVIPTIPTLQDIRSPLNI